MLELSFIIPDLIWGGTSENRCTAEPLASGVRRACNSKNEKFKSALALGITDDILKEKLEKQKNDINILFER